jgi:hypothetical protein
MVYLPKEKFLIQADAYTPPAPNVAPMSPPGERSARQFWESGDLPSSREDCCNSAVRWVLYGWSRGIAAKIAKAKRKAKRTGKPCRCRCHSLHQPESELE